MRVYVAVVVLVAVCLLTSDVDARRRRRRRRRRKTPTKVAPAVPVKPIQRELNPFLFQRQGIAVTGQNDKCGLQLFRYTDVDLADTLNASIAVFCRDKANDLEPCAAPIVIDRAICGLYNAELADLTNNPINNLTGLPYIGDYTGSHVPQQVLGRLSANYPITLGAWLSASGTFEVLCPHLKDAEVTMTFKNLIPNGIYHVVAMYILPDNSVEYVPFGGYPNVIVPDSTGAASMHRFLGKSCPFFPTPLGAKLQTVFAVYGAELQVTSGGIFDSGNFPHVAFPVMARQLSEYQAAGKPYVPDYTPATTASPLPAPPKYVFPGISYP